MMQFPIFDFMKIAHVTVVLCPSKHIGTSTEFLSKTNVIKMAIIFYSRSVISLTAALYLYVGSGWVGEADIPELDSAV